MKSLQSLNMPRTQVRQLGLSRMRQASTTQVRASKTAPATIQIQKETSPGENVYVVGNIWGKWDPKKGEKLKWSDGHVWKKTFDVPVGKDIEFKVVQVNGGGDANWEGGDNRSFKALGPEYGLDVICTWDQTSSTIVEASKLLADGSKGERVPSSTPAADRHSSAPVLARGATAGPGNLGWVGGRTEFTQSRKDRAGDDRSRNSEGLQGVERELVDRDAKAPAWLAKMGLMKELIVDSSPMMRPQIEPIVSCYVYSTWINNGAIQCAESGSHNRPNRHAELAKEMVRSLEWVISEAAAGASQNSPSNGSAGALGEEGRVLAARRLHTRLPSFSGEFRQSTPLTKIRDIAHSNYMPGHIKNEIKHTIQNKLHRCAGPEDLVATEEMLERITKNPGEYDSKFISDFQEFTQELREFFNATGLVDLLEATSPSIDDDHRAINTQLRAAMDKVEASGQDAPVEALMNALSLATQARGFYMKGLSSGLRNDINDDALAMRQRWRLAEIRLEDYAFVVLSRIAGKLEEAGGANTLARANDPGAWKTVVSALTQGMRHLGFSHYAPKELIILESELQAWLGGAQGMSSKMERPEVTALRAKASVERCLRLTSQFADLVMGLYEGPAMRLGNALDVPSHMAQVFGESEVRGGVAFQVSKLALLLSKGLRQMAKQEAWDALVTGEAIGRLVKVDKLSPEAMDEACKGHDDDVVLLVRRAEGDEEVGPLGARLAGVILLQELPHLSHLGVRARQEQVPFVTCDDEDYAAANINPLQGKPVKLQVAAGAVTLAPAASGKRATSAEAATASKAKTGKSAAGPGKSTKVKKMEVVPLAKAITESCGAKAAKCGELERIARSAKGLFSTPPGVTLPFGCMECALAEAGVDKEYQACLQELEKPDLSTSELNSTCERMASIIRKASIPDSVISQVIEGISQESKNGGPLLLAVRSSANVEDLAGLSAAGLYESKVGVPADDSKAVAEAVKDVWASLFSRRAVLSRRAAGVPHSNATMGVLIMTLVAPDTSFVLHTERPHDSNKEVVMAEVAPGQGETLASGTRGTPWRMEMNKSTGKVDTLAFANFSHALMAPTTKGSKGLVEVPVDYTKQPLTQDAEYRDKVGKLMMAVGMAIEDHFGKEPQDIEGGLVSGAPGEALRMVVFQTRPQL